MRKPEVKFPPLPVGACPRILSLDGGGVRGIVQLELLRGIEHALGDHIPASAFFDLIVGTGTGGLIAMTLSMRGQSVSSCSDQFKTICDRAFRPKIKAAAPLVRSISAALGSSGRRYRSKSLYSVLQTTFGENNSLLESQTYFTQGCRVAVTSTNAPDQEPFLLANYPRPETLEQHEQDPNLRVWQSVAAAIADPAYFPPFEHEAQTYLDGGLKCGNPAAIADKERRLLWPELNNPDLFLSLGTGQNSLEPAQSHSKQSSSIDEKGRASTSPGKGARPRMSRQWSDSRRDEDLVGAEKSWNEFKSNATSGQSGSKPRNFVRLNPDLGKTPPAPDSKQEIESLQDTVRKGLQGSRKVKALRNVAHRLVASSFYLDSRSTVTDELGERILAGTLACRFKYGSTQLRALGRILKDQTTADFEPYILIKPDASSKYRSKTIRFTKEIVRVMIERGIFALPSVSIPLQDESKESTLNLFLSPNDKLEPEGFPISGFPDVLDNQLTRQQSKSAMTPRSRQRAFSELPLDVAGQTRKSGFLSRVKSTSAVPPKWSSKRATYSHPPQPSVGRASLSPHEDPIAEEQSQQSSGAFVERRPTSRFWASYKDKSGGGKHSASLSSSSRQNNPLDLCTAEEEISAQQSTRVSSSWHLRNPSVVTTDEYSPLYGGFDSPLGDGFEKKMWSPT
jgi:hypothetical protein